MPTIEEILGPSPALKDRLPPDSLNDLIIDQYASEFDRSIAEKPSQVMTIESLLGAPEDSAAARPEKKDKLSVRWRTVLDEATKPPKLDLRTGGALIGGLIAFPISGIAGYAKLLTSGPEAAQETIESIQAIPQKLIKTPEQQEALEYIMKPIEFITDASKFYGDLVMEWTDEPDLAAATATAFEVLALFGLPKLAHKLTKSVKARNRAETESTIKEIERARAALEYEESKRVPFEEEKPFVPEGGERPSRVVQEVAGEPTVREVLRPEIIKEEPLVRPEPTPIPERPGQIVRDIAGEPSVREVIRRRIEKAEPAREAAPTIEGPVRPKTIEEILGKRPVEVKERPKVKVPEEPKPIREKPETKVSAEEAVKETRERVHKVAEKPETTPEPSSKAESIPEVKAEVKGPATDVSHPTTLEEKLTGEGNIKYLHAGLPVKEFVDALKKDWERIKKRAEEKGIPVDKYLENNLKIDAKVAALIPKEMEKTLKAERPKAPKIEPAGEQVIINWPKKGKPPIEDAIKTGQKKIKTGTGKKTITFWRIDKEQLATAREAGATLNKKATEISRKPKEEPLISKDVKAYDTGEIVKERTWRRRSSSGEMKTMKAPVVYEAELKIVQEMNELRPKLMAGKFEPAVRTFEELGADAKELFYRPVKEAEHRIAVETRAMKKELKKLKKGLKYKSRKRIMAYGLAQQKRGIGILKEMGIKEIPKLTSKEMAVYNNLRSRYEAYYKRLNKARRLSGKNPFPKVENYFTFFRELSMLDRMGFNPIFTSLDKMPIDFLHMKTTPFRFAKARAKAGAMPVELDAFWVFENYARLGIKHIRLSPVIAKGREMLGKFGKGEEAWQLRNEKPRAALFLTDWLDFQAGQKARSFLPPIAQQGLRILNENILYSVLSGNIRSALIQVSALRQTYLAIGPKYTAKGIASLVDPQARNFAMEKSNVLLSRDYDVAVRDMTDIVRSGKIRAAQKKVGKAGLKPLTLLDMETAKATWQGAYEYATKELNYAERKAVNYADDIVTKTQASGAPADISPIQRTVEGKTLTLFQTFVINEWNFLMKDVLGVKNPKMTNVGRMKKVSQYVAATTLANIFFEDLLGVNSPFPTPIRAFGEALERGDEIPSAFLEAGKELVEPIPIIGGAARYGSGIGGATLDTIRKALEGENFIENTAKLLGITPTAQIAKTVKARKRGESLYGQVVGTYTPKEKRSSKKLKSF